MAARFFVFILSPEYRHLFIIGYPTCSCYLIPHTGHWEDILLHGWDAEFRKQTRSTVDLKDRVSTRGGH